MVKVEFLGPIGVAPMELDIKNLQELADILNRDESLKNWLEICAVAINSNVVKDLNYDLNDGDIVNLLPPVCGG